MRAFRGATQPSSLRREMSKGETRAWYSLMARAFLSRWYVLPIVVFGDSAVDGSGRSMTNTLGVGFTKITKRRHTRLPFGLKIYPFHFGEILPRPVLVPTHDVSIVADSVV